MKAELRGSPAHAVWGDAEDLFRFARELLAPTLIAPETLAEATSVQFPGLDGVLPGFGRMRPNDWGLGFELFASDQREFFLTAVDFSTADGPKAALSLRYERMYEL